jgi:hypothetical protein
MMPYKQSTQEFMMIFTGETADTELAIDKYISDVSNMQVIQNIKEGYNEYISILLEYLR